MTKFVFVIFLLFAPLSAQADPVSKFQQNLENLRKEAPKVLEQLHKSLNKAIERQRIIREQLEKLLQEPKKRKERNDPEIREV